MDTLEGDRDMVYFEESELLKWIWAPSSESLSTLKVVNLSGTNIQSLPSSVSNLSALVNLTLRECSSLTVLPPEIGRLKNLQVFDSKGTEIMYLPEEMGNLENLQCLRVSLSTYANVYKHRNGIENIIPRTILSNLTRLEELSIDVNPDAKWWDVELVEAILGKLHILSCLKTLKLYIPTSTELKYLTGQPQMYLNLGEFTLKVGHTEQLGSCLPSELVESFDRLEKCLKYQNGEASVDEFEGLIRHAKALFIRRHWTIERLSAIDMRGLKYCLVAECNEMHTIVDAHDVYGKVSNDGFAFECLEYLAIHSMKKLQSIWKGPIIGTCMSLLQVLALHRCPELTTVFTESMLTQLNMLTVLIVEDCPKVTSLVSREYTTTDVKISTFLPRLRKIMLLDLPELVSISGGLCHIAPRLDYLLVFKCFKLDDLHHGGLSPDVRVIKGEAKWWIALQGGKVNYLRSFVPLGKEGDLMIQLSKDANSLKQFSKLRRQGKASSASSSNSVRLDSQLVPDQQKNEPPARKKVARSDDDNEGISLSKWSRIVSIMIENLKSSFHSILALDSDSLELLDVVYLRRTRMSFELVSRLRSIVMVVKTLGYGEVCVNTYMKARKELLRRFELLCFFDRSLSLETRIKNWIKSVKICLDHDLFAREKQLCEQIFQGFGICLGVIVYGVIIHDYEKQVSDFIYSMDHRNPPPDKIFLILDLYETLDRFVREMCVVMKPSEPTFGTQLFRLLADKISNSLSTFEKLLTYHECLVIYADQVDPLTEYVMSYLYQLCDNKHLLMKLSLPTLPTIDDEDDDDDLTSSLYSRELLKGKSDFSCHVIWFVMILVSNLETQAKLPEDGLARLFYAMKNIAYIIQKINGHSELMITVGDDFFGKLFQKLTTIKVKYDDAMTNYEASMMV